MCDGAAAGCQGVMARWEAASVNSRRDLDQLREKSSSGMEHLTSELSLLQGYVVEHTKSYLASTATSGSQSKEVEEQLHQLVQTARESLAVPARLGRVV